MKITNLASMITALAIVVCLFGFGASESLAQTRFQQRRQARIQKRIERQRGQKIAPANGTESSNQLDAPNESVRPTKHSLDGVSSAGIDQIFTKEESQMRIPGFGRQRVFLIILRQLDLTEDQKHKIRGIRGRVGNQLNQLRLQHIALENQLEEAIYGENFDANRVRELSALVGEKQAEFTRLQASIEADFRQILTPDQFYVFRFLLGEMLIPQRRVLPNRQQMQRRMGQGSPEN
ncbi:MAG: Spy/CpxP family protein refolding chaperone [Acidobacteria bacterium]|nr:Spy/CpxP family protein refolding chaperone [Acidobacteriota bacterium]